MKASNAIFYFLLFIVAWPLFAWFGWDIAQGYASETLVPWVVTYINQFHESANSFVGAAIAIAGAFGAVIALFVALLLAGNIVFRLKRALLGR